MHFVYFHQTVDIRPWFNLGYDTTMEVVERGSGKLGEMISKIPVPEGYEFEGQETTADSFYVVGEDEEIPEGYTRESWQEEVNRPIGGNTVKAKPVAQKRPAIVIVEVEDDNKTTEASWKDNWLTNAIVSLVIALLVGILTTVYTKRRGWVWRNYLIGGLASALLAAVAYWGFMILTSFSEKVTWINVVLMLVFVGHGWWRLSVSAFKPKHWNRDVDEEGNAVGDPKPHIWGIWGCVLFHGLMAAFSFFDYWTFWSILAVCIAWVIGSIYVINLRELWAVTVFRKPVYWRILFFFRTHLKNGVWPSMVPSWFWETRVIVIPHELLEVNPWDTEAVPTDTTVSDDGDVIPGPEIIGRVKMSVIRQYPKPYLQLSAEDRAIDSSQDQTRGIQGVMKRHVLTAFTKIVRQLSMEAAMSKDIFEDRENRDLLKITTRIFRLKLISNKMHDRLINWLTLAEAPDVSELPVFPEDLTEAEDVSGNRFVRHFLRPLGKAAKWTGEKLWQLSRPLLLWLVMKISEVVDETELKAYLGSEDKSAVEYPSIMAFLAKLANEYECDVEHLSIVRVKKVIFGRVYKIDRKVSFFEYVAHELRTQTGVELKELEILDMTPADKELIQKYAEIKLVQLDIKKFTLLTASNTKAGEAEIAKLQAILGGMQTAMKMRDDATVEERRKALHDWFVYMFMERKDDRTFVLSSGIQGMIEGLISPRAA